jgi:putative DNA primase/helicase
VPVRTDGTKAPGLPTWKAYQERHPTAEETVAWFTGDTDGVGVLTGTVSGGLEMLELEGRAIAAGLWDEFVQAADDNGMGELLARVVAGYREDTPSGGVHLLYRVTDAPPRKNTKLARTADREVLIETRGEGGFVVVAPSGGRTHPTGDAWELTAGGIESVARISGAERDALFAMASLFDHTPEPVAEATVMGDLAGGMLAGSSAGTRPGDDYNERATWEEILEPRGWRKVRSMGRGWFWAKPDKAGPGGSATTGQSADGIDRLFVFSTSTEFDTERPYSKFAAYALLEHGGDYASAARDLAAQGYGAPPTQAVTTPAPAATAAPASTPVATTPTLDDVAPPAVTAVAEQPASTLARSEDGHSQALIAEYGTELRYCPQMGRWLHWDGFRWHRQPASGGIAREFAKVIARRYPDDGGWATHKKRSLSAAGTSACLSLTETDYRVTVDIDALDARPWELNTPGGIINLRTGELRDPDPKALHTRSTIVAPDPTADQTPWLDFLLTTFQGDLEVIAFIQRLMGYACVGSVREAILPVFYGQGANGKTVLLETVQAILGDYATVAPQKFLVQGPGQHATEIAALAGARLVIASETNEGERFDEAKVKILTGGDRIKARFMRQDEFTFTPSHLLVMMTNHRPEVGSGGTSFWRRVREVPFTHIVPEGQRDPELKERLVEQHGPAIMAWLAQGAALYARDGLREPEGVRVATQAYEASTDTVSRFVDDMVILGGGDAVKVNYAKVREAYEEWCKAEGETAVNTKALTTQLMGKFGIGRHKGSKGVRFLTGMTLVGSATDEPPSTEDREWGGR